MDIQTVIKRAGGVGAIAKAIKNRLPNQTITPQAIINWRARGQLPRTEWTGETRYAEVICDLLKAMGYDDVHPIDLCPGAGQYMEKPKEKAA